MPIVDLFASSSLGSLLGMRHALEPDHLAAVSTLVTRPRGKAQAALLGAWWGIGHTLSLLVVGVALVVLRAELPARAASLFEFFVAIMLVTLGVRAVYIAARQGPAGPSHRHQHGSIVHTHSGVHAHVHVGPWTLARRPLLVGAIHGLAGSGALTALVLTTLPTTMSRLAYMLLFGLGSTAGMAILSTLLGWPIARIQSHTGLARGISALVGCVSIALGLFWGYQPLVDLLHRTL